MVQLTTWARKAYRAYMCRLLRGRAWPITLEHEAYTKWHRPLSPPRAPAPTSSHSTNGWAQGSLPQVLVEKAARALLSRIAAPVQAQHQVESEAAL